MDSKKRSTPIGYLRDGETFIALTHAAAPSNWYRNALCSGQALLEIKGKPLEVRVEAVNDQAERERIFDLYRRARARNFSRYFDIPAGSRAETDVSDTRVCENDAEAVNSLPARSGAATPVADRGGNRPPRERPCDTSSRAGA